MCVGFARGTYKSTEGDGACSICPDNTGDRCCTTGTFPTCKGPCYVSGECRCNTAFFSATLVSPCTACPANSGSTAVLTRDVSKCLCNDAYIGPAGGPCAVVCADNMYWSVSQCLCDPGYIGLAGGPCSACQPGTYQNRPDADICTGCPLGTYSTTAAASNYTTCVACPTNTYSDVLTESVSRVPRARPRCPTATGAAVRPENTPPRARRARPPGPAGLAPPHPAPADPTTACVTPGSTSPTRPTPLHATPVRPARTVRGLTTSAPPAAARVRRARPRSADNSITRLAPQGTRARRARRTRLTDTPGE